MHYSLKDLFCYDQIERIFTFTFEKTEVCDGLPSMSWVADLDIFRSLALTYKIQGGDRGKS